MATDPAKKPKTTMPWQYPVGGRPDFFDRPGREFTPAQCDFVSRFFYLPYASQVPGLIDPADPPQPKEEPPLMNRNYLKVRGAARDIMWNWNAADIDNAMAETARGTLKVVFRTFDPARGTPGNTTKFESYFMLIFRRKIAKWAQAEWKRRMKRNEVPLDTPGRMPPVQGADRYEAVSPQQKNGLPILARGSIEIETAFSLLETWETRRAIPRRVRYILEGLTTKQRESLRTFFHGFKVLRRANPDAEWSDLAEVRAGPEAWKTLDALERKHRVDNLRQECHRLFEPIAKLGVKFDRSQENGRDGNLPARAA